MTITDETRANHIITQSSGERAITLLAATLNADSSENDIKSVVDLFPHVLKAIKDAVLESIEQTATADAFAGITAAFPGTTEVTNVTQHPAYAGPAQNTPSPAPAPIPGATGGKDDALWTELLQNRGAFYDNRGNKKNPKGPDFSHKTKLQEGSTYKVGLWLKDAPEWAKASLNA